MCAEFGAKKMGMLVREVMTGSGGGGDVSVRWGWVVSILKEEECDLIVASALIVGRVFCRLAWTWISCRR
jgi:hypothetical protein